MIGEVYGRGIDGRLLYDAEIGEELAAAPNQDAVVIPVLPSFGVSPLLRDATREAVTLTAIGYRDCKEQIRRRMKNWKEFLKYSSLCCSGPRTVGTKGGG